MNAVLTAPVRGRSATIGARRTRARKSFAAIAVALAGVACVQVAPAAAAVFDGKPLGEGRAPSFGAPTGFTAADGVTRTNRRVAIGDIDHDGIPDAVSTTASLLEVFLGTGAGSFAPATTYPAIQTSDFTIFLTSIVLADIDHDGNLDAVVANGANNIGTVWLGTGSGTFGDASAVALNPYLVCGESSDSPCLGGFPSEIVVGDFDEDGNPDLLASTTNSSNLTLVAGHGDGTFGPDRHFAIPSSSFNNGGLATADFNHDGHLDVVVTVSGASIVAVLLGDGHGGFGAATELPAGIAQPASVELADLDDDGNLDAIVVNTAFAGRAAILDGDGAGGFAAARAFDVGSPNPNQVNAADLNGDGHGDLTITTGAGVSVFAGDGSGSFGAPVTIAMPIPRANAVADLDGDGRPDIVTAGRSASDVSVLLNTTQPPASLDATLKAHVGGYLQLSGGSVAFPTLRPTGSTATYEATAQLAVRSTFSNFSVWVTASTDNVNLGGLGSVWTRPLHFPDRWAGLGGYESGGQLAFESGSPVNQTVPVYYQLRVPGGTVLANGASYSEPIAYTAVSALP